MGNARDSWGEGTTRGTVRTSVPQDIMLEVRKEQGCDI